MPHTQTGASKNKMFRVWMAQNFAVGTAWGCSAKRRPLLEHMNTSRGPKDGQWNRSFFVSRIQKSKTVPGHRQFFPPGERVSSCLGFSMAQPSVRISEGRCMPVESVAWRGKSENLGIEHTKTVKNLDACREQDGWRMHISSFVMFCARLTGSSPMFID